MDQRRAFSAPRAALLGLIALGGLFGGLVLGWVPLLAAGAAAAVLLAVSFLFLIGVPGPEVKVELSRGRVARNEEAKVLINARRRIPLLPSHAEVPIYDGAGRLVSLLGVRGRGRRRAQQDFMLPTDRRGVIKIGPTRIVRRDPLEIFRTETILADAATLVVQPETVILDPVTAGYLREMEGESTGQRSDSTVAFHGLRDYIPGDDPRSVHWRSTAKTGNLMVKENEETRRWHLAIGLSTADEYASDAEFELGVSVAASLALNALSYGRELTVVTNERRLPALSRNQLLDQFAEVEIKSPTHSVVDLAGNLVKSSRRASVYVIVTGSKVKPNQFKVAQTRFPKGVQGFVLRVRTGARAGRRQIGAMPIISIGSLPDLSKAIRSLAPGRPR